MMKLAYPFALVPVALLLTSCSGTAAAACEESDALVDRVAVAFVNEAEPTGKYGAVAVEDGGYLMAVEYTPAKGSDPVVGTWYTDDLVTGQVFSVDEQAQAASDWGLGQEGDDAKRQKDAGYQGAAGCLK